LEAVWGLIKVVTPAKERGMECAHCAKGLSGNGRPPATCGGCYSSRVAYCGETRIICSSRLGGRMAKPKETTFP
jgi:hypothetical protein